MKKGKIVLIVVVAFLAIGVISGIVHNVTGTTPEESNKETETETSALDMPEEIIWNDKDNMGILNLELDGTKTKQGIISEYYTKLSSYFRELDKESLEDYEYIECVGNVMKDGKIECTIKGNLPIEFIKTTDNFLTATIEDNMQDLLIPKALR